MPSWKNQPVNLDSLPWDDRAQNSYWGLRANDVILLFSVPRVARLEADVEHIKSDVGEIKGTLKDVSGHVSGWAAFRGTSAPGDETCKDMCSFPRCVAALTPEGVRNHMEESRLNDRVRTLPPLKRI